MLYVKCRYSTLLIELAGEDQLFSNLSEAEHSKGTQIMRYESQIPEKLAPASAIAGTLKMGYVCKFCSMDRMSRKGGDSVLNT